MRTLKTLMIVAVVVAVLGAAATFGLRGLRGKVDAPVAVKPGLFEEKNAGFIGLFAARTAPGAHVVIFDTGIDPQGRPIDAVLSALGATRDDVTDVFLTHGHIDHVAGVSVLPKARVHLGAADIPLAAGQIGPEALMPSLFAKMLANPPVTANAPLTGPASFQVGGDKVVKAFPTPGHTPGSYVFLYDGVLIAGDIVVLSQGRLEPTPRMANPHPEQNRAAILSLKSQLANETVDEICTAHGGCTPKGLGKMLLDDLIQRLGG